MPSIQLTLTGSGRNPVRIVAFNGIREYEEGYNESADLWQSKVYYDDSTTELYRTGSSLEYIFLREGPGELQYVRKEFDDDYWFYFYTYTENGVTTPETCIYQWYDD